MLVNFQGKKDCAFSLNLYENGLVIQPLYQTESTNGKDYSTESNTSENIPGFLAILDQV